MNVYEIVRLDDPAKPLQSVAEISATRLERRRQNNHVRRLVRAAVPGRRCLAGIGRHDRDGVAPRRKRIAKIDDGARRPANTCMQRWSEVEDSHLVGLSPRAAAS